MLIFCKGKHFAAYRKITLTELKKPEAVSINLFCIF